MWEQIEALLPERKTDPIRSAAIALAFPTAEASLGRWALSWFIYKKNLTTAMIIPSTNIRAISISTVSYSSPNSSAMPRSTSS